MKRARRPAHPLLTLAISALSGAALALSARGAAADAAGFAFLEVPAGARASALGGAYASMARGVEATYWNPSGLAALSSVELEASHVEFLQTLRDDQFAVASRRFGGGLAASVRAQYSEPIPERDELGNLLGTFGAHDLEFALAYGRSLGGALSLGASAKYVRERIANASAGTYAFDLGAGWQPGGLAGLRLGLAAQNLGPSAAFTIDGEKGAPVPLPLAVQGGGSFAISIGPTLSLRPALEARVTRGRTVVGLVGAELAAAGTGAALRLGTRLNDQATSFGMGAGYERGAMRFDYAFVPYHDDLGDTHRFSLAAKF